VPLTTTVEPRLWGRRVECERLDGLIAAARGGTSDTLVVRGEAGVGKSALLDYLLVHAAGCRLVRAAGVESEMELAFAALHQLCAPFLDRLERLPGPQRDALAIAFGLESGPPPDRFMVGLAVLTLLSDLAETQPVVCLLDDVQWLDRASAQVLGFVARRLAAEAVVMIFAVREPWEATDLAGLTELTVGRLRDADARDLLAAAIPGRLDEPVRERIVAESHGNPLALLELPRAWTPAALAGGFGLPDGASVSAKIEESFRRRMAPLPDDSRRLLLVTAADQIGDPALIRAAADRLGIPADADGPATTAGLLDDRGDLRFRHPMVRTVVYQDAPLADRRLVHRALAEATDPALDPDRRAWHDAAAASEPDEAVALELERSAGRAQARGGVAAAAAFLQRAVDLTPDPTTRSERALTAAQASFQAGEFDAVQRLLDAAEASPLDGFQSAQAALLRGHVAVVSAYDNTAAPLLLEAARQLEPFDLSFARRAYLTAWGAAVTANHLGGAGVLLEIGRAVRALPPLPAHPHPLDLVLEGFAVLSTDGRAAATPILQQAAKAVTELSVEDMLRWGWLAPGASSATWDSEGAIAAYERKVRLVRDAGGLGELPIHLQSLALELAWRGDFTAVGLLDAESNRVAAATGSQVPPFASVTVAPWSPPCATYRV
jgi:tetratricopeptide (TPR) repeat protein